jgi:ABC-2 type transport system ATP-binding protein
VGDIEATCENIAILDEGSLKYVGTVDNLLSIAAGKIYIGEVSKIDLDKIKKEYIVTGLLTKGSKVDIRFVSDTDKVPFEGAINVEPNVEDAYLYLMNGKEEA